MQLSKQTQIKIFMSLKIKIEARLKAKAAGVNLSKKRIEAIVARAEKGLTDESDDTQIDERLDDINELTPFKELAALDDHERAKAKKIEDDKEAARKKAIEEGKPVPVEVDPNETATEKSLRLIMEKLEKQDAVIASFGQEKVANTRRELYAQGLKGTSKEYQERELKKFDRMKFDTDDQFNEFMDEAKDLHADAIQEDVNTGLGEGRPAGGAGGAQAQSTKEASAAEVDAAVESII